jgi:hypothetical protein
MLRPLAMSIVIVAPLATASIVKISPEQKSPNT